MTHDEFTIGGLFYCGEGTWRCTDRGTRTIIAIRIDRIATTTVNVDDGSIQNETLDHDQANRQGWFNGPPYAVAESVFDEYDIGGCSLEPDP